MAPSTTTASGVEVSGHIALAMIKGMAGIDKRYRHVLAEHELDDPNTDSWYPLVEVLGIFETLSAAAEPFVISDMGTRVGDDAQFPTEIDSVQEAFTQVNAFLRSGHRGAGVGSYAFKKTGDNSGTIVCTTPYPCDFDRGFIEAVARRFRPRDSWDVTVVHEDSAPCRKRGGDCCTYFVQW
ncbi:MAG: hypothetical protein U9N87_11410 [Planctomycetota bacterium]|nr:hypothetical protein [Planctomycetota bacterium]